MMAACYPDSDLSISQELTTDASIILLQQHQVPQILKKTHYNPHPQLSSHISSALATAMATSVTSLTAASKNEINKKSKDYFLPLHVDCSVEYELPKQPKPPRGERVEPLLMIHPCYFRKIESQRRSPFINNMPHSSRNLSAIFVGVALLSQDSKIVPSSALISSSKGKLARNFQHRLCEDLPSNFGPIFHTEQQPLHTVQEKPQPDMFISHNPGVLLPSAGSAKFLKRPSIPIQRIATGTVNRTHLHHLNRSTQQNKHQKNLVHNSSLSSKSAANQWDRLATIATVTSSINKPNRNKLTPSSIINLRNAAGCAIATSSTLGKRNAMLLGRSRNVTNSTSKNKNSSLQIQVNNPNDNNISYVSAKKNTPILRSRNSYGMSKCQILSSGGYSNSSTSTNNDTSFRMQMNNISKNKTNGSSYEITCLVHTTKLPLDYTTNTTSPSFMVDQSPVATVPIDFQVAPDAAPSAKPSQKNYTAINHKNESINTNIISSSQNNDQYSRLHRSHPYLTGALLNSNSAALCVSAASVVKTQGDVKALPEFPTVAAAVATPTSFPLHMQQISCYNV